MADCIIDLGPEGGAAGEVIAKAPPESIIKNETNYTAKYINKNSLPKKG